MVRKKKEPAAPAAELSASAEVNKTQVIKNFLAQNPGAMPKDLSDVLRAQGIDVSPGYVSTIKSNLSKKRKKRGPAKEAAAPKAVEHADVPFESLRKAKDMVRQLGGVAKAKEALNALAQLLD
jgi:hypothetical protein